MAELVATAHRLERELSRDPDSLQSTLGLALALHELDNLVPDGRTRVPRAAALYRRAAAAAGSVGTRAMILGNLGSLLVGAEDTEGAREALARSDALCAEAAAAGGQGPPGLQAMCFGNTFNLAKLLQNVGDAAGSEALLRQRLLTPASLAEMPVFYSKAAAALPSYTPDDIVAFEAAARDGPAGPGLVARLEPFDAAWIHYALYKAHRKNRHVPAVAFEMAWRHLEKANALQDSPDYRDGRLASDLQTLRSVFLGAKPARQQTRWNALVRGEQGLVDPTPVFVVGLPRSGSSLVEAVLAAHPQAWGAGEDGALAPLLPHLIKHLQVGAWFAPGSDKVVKGLARRYVETMRQRLPSDRRGVTRIVDKMLFNTWNLGFIAMLLPQARIVHVVRHPADTVLSCFAQSFERRGILWANNLTHIVAQHQQTAEVMALWKRVLPPDRIVTVRYEDMVRGHEAASRKLVEASGLAWDPAVLAFHAAPDRSVATASALQVRRPIYASSLGAWRSFAPWMAPTLRALRGDILAYEAEAGLESSEAFLEQLLDGRQRDSPRDEL